MENFIGIPFEALEINGGFWSEKQKLIAETALPHIYDRFKETNRFAVIAKFYKNPLVKAHPYYDSDTAKWIEAASYVLAKNNYPELQGLCDGLILQFSKLQKKNGYVNSYFQRVPMRKFSRRTDHELYCAGHLAEAALAYFRATGKREFLDVVDRYLDYIRLRFMQKKNASFVTPGHEEIELALYKLYEFTGDSKYKEAADFFLEKRGTVKEPTYRGFSDKSDQHDKPIRELTSADGHAVRAMYLYSAMADKARLNADEELYSVCKRLFADTLTKMYVTGGIGSTYMGESFTIPYDLPNLTAYSESCAAIGLLLFCRRMSLIENLPVYAETVERVLYNNLLSAISLDGKSFFYENPLEIRLSEFTKNSSIIKPPRLPITQRKEVFSTSCCPANVARIIAAIGDNVFTENEKTIVLQQYVACTLPLKNGSLKVVTDYPESGRVIVNAEGYEKESFTIRIPSFCEKYTVTLNGEKVNFNPENGYLKLVVEEKFELICDFKLTPKYIGCNPLSDDNRNCVALTYGPVVYCIEGVDNGSLRALAIDVNKTPIPVKSEFKAPLFETEGVRLSLGSTYSCEKEKASPVKLKFIPYFAFANRGASDMKVWIPKL